MKSIKNRILSSYLLVTFLTLLIIEVIVIFIIKNYYYYSIQNLLEKQAEMSATIYSRYYYKDNLEDIAEKLIAEVTDNTNAEIQIVDNKKILIANSVGEKNYKKIKTFNDTWIGYINNEKILIVSRVLKSDGKLKGYVRFITSLSDSDKEIQKWEVIFLSIGGIVLLIITIISIYIANSISKPVKDITFVAQEMAKGKFDLKARKICDDEVGKLADTLNYMSDELTKTEKLKSEFISSISHELRTPLTAIKGWAITLKSGELVNESEVREGLNIIEEETDRLSNMVEELLDFSRLSSGRIDVNLRKVLLEMMPRANRQAIKLEYEIAEDIEMLVDINRIKQVFINILDNAFKFTDIGGKVLVSLYEDQNNVYIEVRDNGLGISTEELPHVKEKFYKGNYKQSGSGLGLAICEDIVKLHGGNINIISEYGEGTNVKIKFKKTY